MNYIKAKLSDGLSSVELVKDFIDEDAEFFRELENKGIKLNEKQIQMVRLVDGAASINSTAGSGKSTSIASRLAYLVTQKNIPAEKILLLTFTKKAAQEMVEKAKNITNVSKGQLSKITSGTFHSVFLGILREFGEERDIWASDKSRQITIKTIMRSIDMTGTFEAEDVLALISSNKNRMISLEEFEPETKYDYDLKRIWSRYEQYKQEKSYIDFDDMLLLTYKLLTEDESVLAKLRNRFKYIMVDEYQDTSTIQDAIVKLIADPLNNVVVVGDLDQCIFSFSGARVENILNFNQAYPNAQSIMLDVNYRSSNTILGLSNNVIDKNTHRIKKEALSIKDSNTYPNFIYPYSSTEEAEYIVKEIKKIVDAGESDLKDFAVLYRNGSNSRAIFEELLMNDVPFVQYGNDEVFYEGSIIKPLMAYFRLVLNSQDMAAIGDILPTLYLGKDKYEIIKKANKNNPISNPIEYVLGGLKSFQKGKVEDKLRLINRVRSGNYKPIVAVKMFREEYEKFLIGDDSGDTTTLHKEVIRETLDEFESSLKRHKTIQEFIDFANKVIKNAKMQKDLQKKENYDAVRLMTIHRAKGLEYPHVYLISMVDGVMPHSSAIEECTDIVTDSDLLEEERRLLYVGITRSKTFLTLSIPKVIRNREVEPSRFLEMYI